MNIISNAIDALEGSHFPNSLSGLNNADKRIEIKTKQLTNNFIAIHVKDNGGGISEENRQRIFDPFFTTKPIGKGTGLGLSISYQVVTSKHKGNLQCITKPGEGTEFIILLPVKQNHVDDG
jgi:signal transduction histidine kinase